jgi:hypothetical protein
MKHHHIAGILIVTTIFFALVVGYFYFFDGDLINKIIEIKSAPITEFSVYQQGATVNMKLSYCKYRNLPALTEWTLIDDTITFYSPQVRSTNELGCFDKLVPIEQLPQSILPGRYHFAGTLTYRPNGLRTIMVELKTNDFTVIR